jgi:hypothetical protein
MKVLQVVPEQAEVDVAELVQRIGDASLPSLAPFDPATLSFCEELSRQLFRHPVARSYPETQALAFWMRKSQLQKLQQEFASLSTQDTLLVPRGVVFHGPPANVDTIFVYSWLFSVLAGNRNIVRLSTRSSEQVETICQVYNELLASAPEAVRQSTVMVRYGHDAAITGALSAACQVRVIWGGDGAINNIRSVPIPPRSKEITFADRYSWSVIAAEAYLRAHDAKKNEIASQFYLDIYSFSQMACSSPRILVWHGGESQCQEAGGEFMRRLRDEITRRSHVADVSVAMRKLLFSCEASLDQPVSAMQSYGNELTILQLDALSRMNRDHCGGGLLFQCYLSDLEQLVEYFDGRDQTLTYFGFEKEAMQSLARKLNGRGLDRIVPIGQALNFHRFWDGYDLMGEMTKRVFVD